MVCLCVGNKGDWIKEDQYKDSEVMTEFFLLNWVVGIYSIMLYWEALIMFYYTFAYALWTNFLNGVNMLTLFASPQFDFWSKAKSRIIAIHTRFGTLIWGKNWPSSLNYLI